MKKHGIIFSLSLFSLLCNAASEQSTISPTFSTNPMNEKWFYDPKNPYSEPNRLLREKQWQDAEFAYRFLIQLGTGSPHDQAMASINMASCCMAQAKSSTGWAAVDTVIGIPKEKQLEYQSFGHGKTVFVHTNYVGIGDIGHFLAGVAALLERGYVPTVAIRPFCMPTFQSALNYYGVKQVAEKTLVETDYQAHSVSLLGYFEIMPNALCPEKSIYTATEEALLKFKHIDAIQNPLVYLFLGEEKPGAEPRAVLMGGAFLPHEKSAHGRHLTSEAFNALLQQHPSTVIVDCSPKANRLVVDNDLQARVLPLPAEREAFDTTIAAAIIMNQRKNMTAMTADNGPGNIFISALDKAARRRAAVIIPNGKEYDMRAERYEQDQETSNYVKVRQCSDNNEAFEVHHEGDRYVQQISNCWIYRCNTPADQTAMVEHAFEEMNSFVIEPFVIQ